MRKILLLLLTIFFVAEFISGQGNEIFDESYVHEIRINFDDPDYWNSLTNNYDNFYPNIPYILADVNIDGNSLDSIGVRLKGYSSYFFNTSIKKSIKLDFNEFVAGRKYDGLKKLNLNNGTGDPAIQRDAICFDLMRKSGVAAPRTSYAKIFLNDTYWGLYVLIEQIDKVFLTDQFGSKDGHLFKNMGNSDLKWEGADSTIYQEVFDLKTGQDPNAWNSFINFVDVLNNTSDQDFKEEIEKVFDVNRYLKTLTVDVAMNNWDSYIQHGRNFYIYENPITKRFQWIPWDYNLAMGGSFALGFENSLPADLSECNAQVNGSCPYPANDLTFIKVVESTPDCCNDTWSAECEEIYQLILMESTAPEDCQTIIDGSCPYPPTDSTFLLVINEDPFCCETVWDDFCQQLYDNFESGDTLNGGGGDIGYDFPIDMSESEKVLINRLLAIPEYQEIYYENWCRFLRDDLDTDILFKDIDRRGDLIRPHIETDPNYVWNLNAFEQDLDQGNSYIVGLKKFLEQRKINLIQELPETYTCKSISTVDFGDIVINEFCASCDSLSNISDGNGEYDDWIELYNNTEESIDLSNAFMTDKLSEPNKWPFPPGTIIPPNAFLIVWADSDEGQEGLHANFKLAKAGEFLMLTNGTEVLDSLSFGEQITNQTFARIPNGTGDFQITEDLTFNANNDMSTSVLQLVDDTDISVFPNPTINQINILLNIDPEEKLKLFLTDPLGRRVLSQDITNRITIVDVEHLQKGIYVINLLSENRNLRYSQKLTLMDR